MATFKDVSRALDKYARNHSRAAANRVLERVTGTTNLSELAPEQYSDVIRELGAADEDGDITNEDGTLNTVAIYAHWNSTRRGAS